MNAILHAFSQQFVESTDRHPCKSATVIDLSTSTGDVKPIKGYLANTTRPLTMWADLSDDSLFLVTTEVSLPNDQDRRSANLSIGIYELDEFEVKRQAKRE